LGEKKKLVGSSSKKREGRNAMACRRPFHYDVILKNPVKS